MQRDRLKRAMKRVEAGEVVSQVAREIGISTAAIYAERKRRKGLAECPCCRSLVEKSRINREALK